MQSWEVIASERKKERGTRRQQCHLAKSTEGERKEHTSDDKDLNETR